MDLTPSQLASQVGYLLILAIPVSCVAWTVTHEEIFREMREYFVRCSESCSSLLKRKFFYLFTCEYCFSHYVVALTLLMTRFKLLYPDWRGYVLSFFAMVWVANAFMSLYGRLRVDITSERAEAKAKEKEAEKLEAEAETIRATVPGSLDELPGKSQGEHPGESRESKQGAGPQRAGKADAPR